MAANLAFLHELDPHMIGIGPFIPHSSTPLASKLAGTMEETLFLLACLRLAHPRALLPATTALATIDPQGRMAGLEAGANGLRQPNSTASSKPLLPRKGIRSNHRAAIRSSFDRC